MPTVENFRAALNDVAADTPPLPSAQLLRAGRRLRRRRRVLAGCGTALAVAGIATGAGLVAAPSSPPPAPLAQTSSPAAEASSPAPAAIDLSALDAALVGDAQSGVVISDGPTNGAHVFHVRRDFGQTTLPPAGAGATTRLFSGVGVRITSVDKQVRYEWISSSEVRWTLTTDVPVDDDFLGGAVRLLNERD